VWERPLVRWWLARIEYSEIGVKEKKIGDVERFLCKACLLTQDGARFAVNQIIVH
jgi:hypothetical protein